MKERIQIISITRENLWGVKAVIDINDSFISQRFFSIFFFLIEKREKMLLVEILMIQINLDLWISSLVSIFLSKIKLKTWSLKKKKNNEWSFERIEWECEIWKKKIFEREKGEKNLDWEVFVSKTKCENFLFHWFFLPQSLFSRSNFRLSLWKLILSFWKVSEFM